ncbi:unnamed protein product [Symbiodinium natans]|uniref:Fe2OG dioxygenase domain-containing protein n=1 Tax=Symbiodinium natans TaxID=878477 RepID=A0A812SJ85_9DINO|nr:unnamed protein product [Symbiodinium natans]
MLEVHISSATTGQNISVVHAGHDWTVHELSGKLASQLDVLPYSQVLLHGAQPLKGHERLQDFLDAEGATTLELQLLRKSWVVTVADHRPESKSAGKAGSGDKLEVDVEAYPGCSLRDFCARVAEKFNFKPATRPQLAVNGQSINWQTESETSLADLGIQPDSNVRVIGVSDLPLVCIGTPALQSRRSEFLESNCALSLIDQCQAGHFHFYPQRGAAWRRAQPSLQVLHSGESSRHCDAIFQIAGFLTETECNSISASANALALPPTKVECFRGTRRYQRLVARDGRLASQLWERAERWVRKAFADRSTRPLGFGCVQGDWELAGLNPCFRVNSYGPEGFLKPHRDAPFSPDVNARSLCTLLIPLSSVGKTRFFHPVQEGFDYRGMTLQEELEARGGLAAGFRALDVCLSAGSALLFGQGLLHEGIPADGNQRKVLLRTDVLVRRRPPVPAVLMTAAERKDQTAALRWFREAQHQELRQKPCNDLYERALSYRYFYPSEDVDEMLEPVRSIRPDTAAVDQPSVLPSTRLERYPDFVQPELIHLMGPVAAFRLPHEQPTEPSSQNNGFADDTPPAPKSQSTAKHLRASAMYALHMLGHHGYSQAVYTVNFDPQSQQVTAVPLKDLLVAAFEARPCYGAIYNVAQRHDTVEEDFEAAVDRTNMALQHGCAHIGLDLLAGLKSEVFAGDYSSGGVDLRDDDKIEELHGRRFSASIRQKYQDSFSGRSWPAPETPDWQRYLGKLLSDEAGKPGLDLVATAVGERNLSLDMGHVEEDIDVEARPLNHLVFDFSKHELVVHSHAQAPSPRAPYDPEALWLELLQQWYTHWSQPKPRIPRLPKPRIPRLRRGRSSPRSRSSSRPSSPAPDRSPSPRRRKTEGKTCTTSTASTATSTASTVRLYDDLKLNRSQGEGLQPLEDKLQGNVVLKITARSEPLGQVRPVTLIKDTAESLAVFIDGKALHCMVRGAMDVLPHKNCIQWSTGGQTSCWILDDIDPQAVTDFLGSPGYIFERYEVSLAAIAREGAGFHHAAEMNGVERILQVQVEHAGLALSDHTTTVLCGVAADPQTEAAVVWTIYHGLSAL